MPKRAMTALRRARIFDAAGGICHLCGVKISVGEAWDAEHVIALEISGDDSDDNIRPAHVACHRQKTPQDARLIAKAKRVHAKHIGAKTRPQSRWKRKIDGTVVDRETGEIIKRRQT